MTEYVFSVQSVLDRLEQQGLADLAADYAEARIVPGCTHRYAVRLSYSPWGPQPSQWWECDSLAEVRARIVWALANR